MRKKLFCIVMIIALIIALLPLAVSAGGIVILNAIQEKYRGDSVTISGTTALDDMTVKVLRPNNTVLYVNVLEGGSFKDTFSLPGDTALGIYTVIVGKGQNVATTTFRVIEQSGGGDEKVNNGGVGPTPTKPPVIGTPVVEVLDSGASRVVTEPALDEGSSTAVSTVSAELMEKAFGQAKETSEGVRTVVLKVPEVKGAVNYALQIPANVLSSGEKNTKIEMETPLGTVSAPGNMFKSNELINGKDVKLTIGLADKAGMAEDIKRQIGDRPVIELNVMAGDRLISWNNPDAPVTVSIDYTPTAQELKDPEHIVVWYIDGQGNVTPVPNGRYDAAAGKVTFTTTHMSKYAVAFVKKTFSDIGNYPWAKKEIEVLASKGIIKGTSSSSYSPKSYITRADFVSLLMKTLELETSFTANFDDVKPSDYYYGTVGTAKKLGIIKGVGNNKFNPKASITREDMMVITTNAMEVAGKMKNSTDISVLSVYKDSSMISSYARTSVAALVKNGIIIGDGKLINPKAYTTRAEIAVAIYRIYNRLVV